jgi:uncharacterized membrane protein
MSALFSGSILLVLVFMFIFVVLVIAAVVVAAWALGRSGILGGTAPERVVEPRPGPTDDALDIVRRRYARDEITKEEYERLRQDLET